MVMPGPAYDEARLRARYHVQVELAQAGVVKTPARVLVVESRKGVRFAL